MKNINNFMIILILITFSQEEVMKKMKEEMKETKNLILMGKINFNLSFSMIIILAEQ